MSRKIIIPKGLVDDTNQNSIIEVSSHLAGSRGNLIAKRQGKKLVAQQLPDWQDALSSASPTDQMANNTYVASPAGCRPYQEGQQDETQFYSQVQSEPSQYHSALSRTYDVPAAENGCCCRPQDDYSSAFEPQAESTPIRQGGPCPSDRTFVTGRGAGRDQTYTYPGTPRPQNVTYAAGSRANDQTLTNRRPDQTYSVPSAPGNQTVTCPGTPKAASQTYTAKPRGRNDRTFVKPPASPLPSWFQPRAQSTPAPPRNGSRPSDRTYVAGQGARLDQTYAKTPCPASRTFTAAPANQRGRNDQTYTYPANETYTAGPMNQTYSARPMNQTYSAGPMNQTYSAGPMNQTYSAGSTNQTYSAGRMNQTFTRPPRADQTYDACTCGPPQTSETSDLYPVQYAQNATYDVDSFEQSDNCTCDPSGYDAYSESSAVERRAPRSPPQTLPRAPPGRMGRRRPGEETFPRSANRSVLEEGGACPPCDEASGLVPTDESYENRFHPVWTSSWNSLTDLNSQEVTEMEARTDQCGIQ